jgi:hypothetical protein
MKSGTTTLANYLFHHNQIAIPEWEIGFFSKEEKFIKGYDWYESYVNKYATKNTKIRGEKTPYSYISGIEKEIFEYNPNMKLIWIFRNPVDRAFSNYNHDVFLGEEWRSFRNCLKNEDKRSTYHRYIEKGFYSKQVENYLKFFPKEQMHFVIFEDLIKNKREELTKVLKFLDVSEKEYDYDIKIHSKSSPTSKYNPSILYFYNKYISKKGRIHNFLWNLNFSNKSKNSMTQNERTFLLKTYQSHNQKLSELIKKDLTCWKS